MLKKCLMFFKKIQEGTRNKELDLKSPLLDKGYYQEAKLWYEEIYESPHCSRDRYRLLSILLGGLLTLSLISFSLLLPLKRYYYRILSINQTTGEITTLKELEANQYAPSWVMSRYFISQYVQNKNVYHFEDIKRTFNLTLAMSAPNIAKAYQEEVVDSNPLSPINMLGKEGYRDVILLSINQLNTNTALARFRTLTHAKDDSSAVKTEDFQAVIKWRYQNVEASLQERDLNPLGFQVTYYQASPLLGE